MDPHSFFANPDPAVLLNADPGPDPDPAAVLMRIRIQLNKISKQLPCEEFSGVEKDNKDCSKIKIKPWT